MRIDLVTAISSRCGEPPRDPGLMAVELRLIHPLEDMNLFVVQAQAPDIKTAIYRGIVPSLPAPLVLIALLWYFPALMDAGSPLWLKPRRSKPIRAPVPS